MRTLIVPLDGSEAAQTVLPLAVELARDLSLRPCLLQVIHPFDDNTTRRPAEAVQRAGQWLRENGVEAVHDVARDRQAPGESTDDPRDRDAHEHTRLGDLP